MALKLVNPNADQLKKAAALSTNISAGRGLQDVLKTNLGPKGTIKMLVSGAGDIKITKDGNTLLHEMQIQNPTAALIARTATAQDDITGDGTTSAVLIIGELLNQAGRLMESQIHPRVITDGFDQAKWHALKCLDDFRVKKNTLDRDVLISVARTSLRTKVKTELADKLAEIVVDGLLTIHREGKPIDLFMVEIMSMQHRGDMDTQLVKGMVLDHGARHPDMKKRAENAFILTANVSLEYEKSEINSSFFYKSAEQREQLVEAERKFTDDKVRQLIAFKNKVCPPGSDKSFVLVNQKGIDPISLDLLAKEGIVGLRRAKRRNMERITKCCGGAAVNSFDELTEDVLGYADLFYEHTLGEDKFTFIEGVKNPESITILIKGSTKHSIAQTQDALRDGLRAVKNAIEDGYVVPGAGAFEVYCHRELMKFKDTEVKGRAKLGVNAFAEALLVIPRVLAQNSGLDQDDTVIKVQDEVAAGHVAGIDIETGDVLDPAAEGIWDNYAVKRQLLHSSTVIATQLLLVDEIIRAGRQMKQNNMAQ